MYIYIHIQQSSTVGFSEPAGRHSAPGRSYPILCFFMAGPRSVQPKWLNNAECIKVCQKVIPCWGTTKALQILKVLFAMFGCHDSCF